MTSGFEEASLRARLFEELRSRQCRGLLQELKYFRLASSSKLSCPKSSLCSLQRVSSAVYSWLYITFVLYLSWYMRTSTDSTILLLFHSADTYCAVLISFVILGIQEHVLLWIFCSLCSLCSCKFVGSDLFPSCVIQIGCVLPLRESQFFNS